MKKCKICNLPSNYPGLTLDENDICNICKDKPKKINYKGLDALKERINKILAVSDSNREYDCVVGYSGGRDSSYLLYFAKKVLNLRVLAITLDHDFMPNQTKKNINNLAEKLGVTVKFIPNKSLNKSSRKCIKTWSKKPDPAMCITFCTGCRYGIKKIIPAYAKKHNIPILLVGNTPYEIMDYRKNLLCENSKKYDKKSKITGYISKLIKNPRYLLSPSSMYQQLLDFISYEGKTRKNQKPIVIKPFYNYIEWNKEEVISKIQELGWEYDKSLNSSWRSDCYVNILRQYYYKKMLGFNDLNAYYARLIRNGEISKDKALDQISQESNYDDSVIKEILKKYYNLDFDKINKNLN